MTAVSSRAVSPLVASRRPSMSTIDLDAHATTPCDPRVVQAMLPCFGETYGNAHSPHARGRAAARRVDGARGAVADLLGCDTREIVFTSGATESINLALKGVVDAAWDRDPSTPLHIVTAVTEHKAVLDVCARLEKRGVDITYLPVDPDGRIDPDRVAAALRDDTVLVSLMLANNEIGVLNPIADVSAHCREHGVLLHCDAAQALSTVECHVDRLGVDLLSISGHKAYGPQGVGALYLRRRRPRVRITAQMDGGGHQGGRRSGTLNLPGIVGLGRACELIAGQRRVDGARLTVLRDRLLERLTVAFPDLRVNGSLEHRLPHNLNVSIPGLVSEHLLETLEGVAISSGAACSSSSNDGSYVLKALAAANGDPNGERAESSLRMGLGRFTTAAQIERAADLLIDAVAEVRYRPAAAEDDACGVTCAPATLNDASTTQGSTSGPRLDR